MPDITLKQIKDTCENYDCDDGCPLYTEKTQSAKEQYANAHDEYIDKDSCLFRSMPEDWDIKEIEERIKP